MLGRLTAILVVFFLAFSILGVSILRTSHLKFAFYGPVNPSHPQAAVLGDSIDYELPFPGKILPDHPIWFLKVARDKFWLLVTTDTVRKAELNILFADKRLAASKILFERGKPELGLSTLIKADKYLEGAYELERQDRERGINTSGLLYKLANATLAHGYVVDEITDIAPEDAKPELARCHEQLAGLYNGLTTVMRENDLAVPENPFNGEE